jgi:hypothetical protein
MIRRGVDSEGPYYLNGNNDMFRFRDIDEAKIALKKAVGGQLGGSKCKCNEPVPVFQPCSPAALYKEESSEEECGGELIGAKPKRTRTPKPKVAVKKAPAKKVPAKKAPTKPTKKSSTRKTAMDRCS